MSNNTLGSAAIPDPRRAELHLMQLQALVQRLASLSDVAERIADTVVGAESEAAEGSSMPPPDNFMDYFEKLNETLCNRLNHLERQILRLDVF